MNHGVSIALGIFAGIGLSLTASQLRGETGPFTHTIFMTAMELKGGTSLDKLTPPTVNPKDLSQGYEFKLPGEADKRDPKRWEVSSYIYSPGFVTVRQGDTVNLIVFVVNGDAHESWINDPEGRKVVPNIVFNRGREYHLSFVAEKVGSYKFICSHHAPTMTATFMVLPRQ